MHKSIINSLDYLIKDAIIVTEKVMEAIKLETINAAEGNCPYVVRYFTGFTPESVKEIMKEMWIWQKNGRE